MTEPFYDELADVYDRMIRWERRIAFERPLFETIWKRHAIKSVLDAACGNGAHLELFIQQGLRVAGSDASAGMVERARRRLEAALPPERRPPVVQSTWSDLPERVTERFDAVLCLGNSLPYVLDEAELRRSLEGLASRVAPGGILLLQWKNFAGLRAKGERFLPLATWRDPQTGAQALYVRQYEWHATTVDFIVVELMESPPGEWKLRHWVTPLRTYDAEQPCSILEKIGMCLKRFGSLKLDAFDARSSEDIVLFATTSSRSF